MVFSYIIYIGLGALSVYIAYLADEKDNKKILWIAIIALSLIFGLRARTVGIDTNNYFGNIENIIRGGVGASAFKEKGYAVLVVLLSKIKSDVNFIVTIFGFITNGFIMMRLWDDRDIISLPWAAFRYYTLFFIASFNIMRQIMSLAVVFWGTRYLRTKEYYKALIFFLLASSIHLASLVSLAFFAFEVIDFKLVPLAKKVLIIVAIFMSPLIVVMALNMATDTYSSYLVMGSTYPYRSWIFKTLLFFGTLPFLGHGQAEMFGEGTRLLKYRIKTCKIYYFCGLVIGMFSAFYSYAWRVAYPFYIFEIIYVGMLAKSAKSKWLICTGMLIIYMVSFIRNCLYNSMGQMPYEFFWW